MLEFTEGKIVAIPYVAEQRNGAGVISAGTDCEIKIYDIDQDQWWDGDSWEDAETPLTMVHLSQGSWEYDWTIPTGITGHDITFIRYNEVDGCVAISDTVTIQATGKTGSIAVNARVQDADTDPVAMIPLIVRDNDENTIFGRDISDELGLAGFELDAGTYQVRLGPNRNYVFNNPYVMVVSDTMDDPFVFAVEAGELIPYEGMTFGQLKSQVALTLLDVYPDRLTPELVEGFVQNAHLETDMEIKFTRDEEHIDSVGGQYEYTMSWDRRNIVLVTYGDSASVLEQINFEEMLKLKQVASVGVPQKWAVWGARLILYPAPGADDTDICLWIVRVPAPLICDGDIPTLPAELHQSLVDYALARAYIHLGDSLTADEYLGLWRVGMNRWASDVKEWRIERGHVEDVDDV